MWGSKNPSSFWAQSNFLHPLSKGNNLVFKWDKNNAGLYNCHFLPGLCTWCSNMVNANTLEDKHWHINRFSVSAAVASWLVFVVTRSSPHFAGQEVYNLIGPAVIYYEVMGRKKVRLLDCESNWRTDEWLDALDRWVSFVQGSWAPQQRAKVVWHLLRSEWVKLALP